MEANLWGRRGVTFAWIATALLVASALRAGFSLDDFLQRIALEGGAPELELGPATLYDFTGGERGTAGLLARGYVPWSTDPRLEMRFFRPLSSLSIALDQALFGRAELPSHLVSAALFSAITALSIALFRKLLTPNRAGLAAFLFAVAGGHAVNLAWVAGRHVLVGALFGTLAVLVHVLARQGPSRRPRLRWLSPISLTISLLASETSLAALAMIASYELFASGDEPGRRLRRAAPWLAAGLGYVALYSAAGYGVKHSGLYVSPVAMPGEFLREALTRLPMLLGELAFAVPASLWVLVEPARPALAAVGAAGAGLVVWLAFRTSASAPERRQVVWFSAAAALGTLPMVGGVLDGRTLLIPFLASMPLVATAIDGAWNAQAKAARLGLRALGGLFFFLHVVVAVLARASITELMVGLAKQQRELAKTADFSRCSPGSPSFLVSGADPALCLAGRSSLAYYRPDLTLRHPNFDVLSLSPNDQRIERTGETSIVLHVDGRPRRSTIFERLFRDGPLAVGQKIAFRHYEARVLATERGLPTRVAFELPASACLLVLEKRALVGHPLPVVGTTWSVPHELGPMGL